MAAKISTNNYLRAQVVLLHPPEGAESNRRLSEGKRDTTLISNHEPLMFAHLTLGALPIGFRLPSLLLMQLRRQKNPDQCKSAA